MDNENKPKEQWSNYRYLRLLIGVILICFGLVGYSNFSIIGEFITYTFSYLFGVFYPVIIALIIILGLVLVFKKQIAFKKGYSLIVFGFILLLVSVLAIGSYSILNEDNVTFTKVSSVFYNRMIGYARYPFKVDDFSHLSYLGGGFIGLFLVSLIASMAGNVFSCVFYSILMFISLVFLLYLPISYIAKEIKKKKDAKVVYDSPNQKNKGENSINPLVKPTVRNDTIFGDIDLHADAKPRIEEDLEMNQNIYSQGGFTSNYQEKETEPVITNSGNLIEDYKRQASENNVKTLIEKDRFDEENISSQAAFKTNNYPFKTENNNKPQTIDDFEALKNNNSNNDVFKYSSYEDKKEENIVTDQEDTKVIQESQVQTTSYVRTQRPDFNPLEKQAENVKNLVTNKPVQNEVSLDYEEETPVSTPVEEEMAFDQEDEEERIERLFFEMKDRKENEKKNAKEKEKEEKLSAVMKYVNNKPRIYEYALPTDDLLEEQDSGDKLQQNTSAAKEKAKIINQVFQDFHFPAKAMSFTIGASVTRFNIQTEPGVKADKIESLLSELQRALNGDQSVRIQTVVEGRSTSGVEVGNAKQMPVSFKTVFQEIEKDTKNNLLIPIGKDISGNIVTYPLNDMPHLLVAGTTGSGKSVLVNCMIMTLIMRNYPSQLKLMLIDPKQVEFAKYNMEPHLLCPVIQDTESAAVALNKLVDEMERRYSILRENNVVKIADYRKKQASNDKLEELPDIAVFIDEFADLMNTGGDQIATCVQRLTQKSRAAGIYLVIATQRPSKDAIPMIIKANIVCRVGLSCSSQVDSRVILDENGCETLVGKGDLLFKCPGKRSLLRCQSAYISDEEMDKVLEYVREEAGDPSYNKDFIDLQVEAETEDAETTKTLDDIFDDVKDYVMYTGICSRSHIMNYASLSAAKADQMIARLKNLGIIKTVAGGKNVVAMRKKMED